MSATKFNAVFQRDEAGSIYAHVPELPEVQTQGRTLEEGREMVLAAISQALELRQYLPGGAHTSSPLRDRCGVS